MSSDVVTWFNQHPPIARTITAAVFVSSIILYAGVVSPFFFAWLPWKLFHLPSPDPWQLFTIVANFLVTGPKIGILMDPYWLFKWCSILETTQSRFSRKEDLVWYIILVSTCIHVLNYYFVGQAFLLSGLSLAMCYTACQDARGESTHLLFFQIPTQMMPLGLMAMTAVMSGSIQAIYLELCGLVAAHLYDVLSRIFPEFGGGPNIIPTPSWLSWIITTPRTLDRAYGTALRPSENSMGGGPLPSSWKTRGQGQRLGAN